MGILTDRFGGRVLFSILLLVSALAAFLLPRATDYTLLLGAGFLLGVAGSSFAAGVAFVSKWFPPQSQGSALGVYGVGNAGQSVAVFLGPILALSIGRDNVFVSMSVLLVVWAVVFFLFARNAPAIGPLPSLGSMLEVLTGNRLAWYLAAFYFVTFGGFIAFSIYLPSLLVDDFQLSGPDAGFRTAGFVILATLLRPVGGILSDHIGGARVLGGVFTAIIPFAALMAWNSMIPFTVGALGCAALLGLGNGAVFKLVPQYFPKRTGAVTGLVGAMGGLGGFFPPILLGIFRDSLGVVWPGFFLLAASAAVLGTVNRRAFLPHEVELEKLLSPRLQREADRLRAALWATLITAVLCAAIVVGSRNLQNFDAALVVYTFAVIFATWGVTYHYATWMQKPPTRRYWERSVELVKRFGIGPSLAIVGQTAATHIVAQNFIAKRSKLRWWMHFASSGMHERRRHHVPSRLRMDSLHLGCERPDDLHHLAVRFPGEFL